MIPVAAGASKQSVLSPCARSGRRDSSERKCHLPSGLSPGDLCRRRREASRARGASSPFLLQRLMRSEPPPLAAATSTHHDAPLHMLVRVCVCVCVCFFVFFFSREQRQSVARVFENDGCLALLGFPSVCVACGGGLCAALCWSFSLFFISARLIGMYILYGFEMARGSLCKCRGAMWERVCESGVVGRFVDYKI